MPPSSSLLTHHPLKALYALSATLFETLVRLPLLALLYALLPSRRPDPHWTLSQSLRIALVRAIILHTARIQTRAPLSLAPGPEGPRFEVLDPAPSATYRGPLDDPDVRPAVIGGTWYPARYDGDDDGGGGKGDKAVVLHFHGGAFVLGDGREADCGRLARTMLEVCGRGTVSHVFCPQYRLAGAPTRARFPAAVQDAVSAYLHLLRHHSVPARRVVVSGDSAGGNVVVALLRYIAEFGEEVGVEAPGCAWLWSPWVRPAGAVEGGGEGYRRSVNYGVDYLSVGFGAWGARCYGAAAVEDVYVSGGGRGDKAFRSPGTPIWIQTGGREMLLQEDVEFYEELKKANEVECELEIVPYAPHDIALVGHIVGFSREYAQSLKKAEAFYKRVSAAAKD